MSVSRRAFTAWAVSAAMIAGTAASSFAQDLSGSIRFSWYGGTVRNEKTDRIVKLFESKHPGVTIEQEPQDWVKYWERLNVQAAGGRLPCVIGMLPYNLNDYSSAGLLADLQPMIDAGQIDVSDIPADIVAAGKGGDGKLYMLPYGAAPDTIAFNASLAERAGIEPLPEAFTWDDYFAWLRAAQPKLPEGVYAVDFPANNPNLILAYIGAQGHPIYADGKLGFPKEVLVDWWTTWRDLSKEGVMIPPDMLAEEPSQHEMSYFAGGRALASNRPANAQIALAAGIAQRNSDDRLEVRLYPTGPAGVGDIVPSNSLSVAANCDNAPLASAFVDFFLNDPEAAKIYASDNGAVTNTKLLEAQLADPATSDATKTLLTVFQAVSARGSRQQAFPSGFQKKFTEVHKRLTQQVLFGALTPQQAADAFFAESQ